ncbi:MAG: BatD family protein [Deinococcales bacterium]|nr:BatD family protein [Chitinophagaceae bacterium]
MRKQLLFFIIFIFFVLMRVVLIAQSSVQLPGGVQYKDTNVDIPYVLNPNADVGLIIKQNIFVRVNVTKKQCFEGEPILVIYKLYTSLQSESSLAKQPEFSGCSVIEMTTNDLTVSKEIIDGKTYKSYIIRKVQLVPLQAGNITLGTAEVENTISFFKTVDDAYNGIPFLVKNITIGNEPLTITVKPLPSEKQPANFRNSIGNFIISAKVAKLIDTANDNNHLEIRIDGAGNFQNIVCPVVSWPASIEHFEADVTESIDKLSFPASGKKIFTIPFTCKKEGAATIPPINFSFFDSDTKQYETVSTDSIFINILPAVTTIDTTKISEEVGNGKYILIVLCIAIVASIILWLTFFKPTKKVVKIAKMKPVESPTIFGKPNAEKLNDLLFIEDEKTFTEAAKALAITLLQTENNAHKITELNALIDACNQRLYAYNLTLTKSAIMGKLEQLITKA